MSTITVRDLSERQEMFCYNITKGKDPTAAAEAAGYSHPHVAGWRLLRSPQVAAVIHKEIQRQLAMDAAPLAYKVAMDLLRSDKTSERVRADLAVKMLQLAGHVAPTGKDDGPGKALNEMSSEELRAYIEQNQAELDRLEAELASRAKEVSASVGAPNTPSADASALDYLD